MQINLTLFLVKKLNDPRKKHREADFVDEKNMDKVLEMVKSRSKDDTTHIDQKEKDAIAVALDNSNLVNHKKCSVCKYAPCACFMEEQEVLLTIHYNKQTKLVTRLCIITFSPFYSYFLGL